jgi:HEAT repeat protein
MALSKEALQTIKEMSKQFAASPWVKDAKALEVEIRQAAGQAISADLQGDEELKLLALRGIMQTDPDKGLPIIEKMLAGGTAPRVRDRALFVLSQSRSPKARDIMLATAKNNANPELQLRAVRYLGMMGAGEERDLLPGIYRGSSDLSVKRTVLNSLFMQRNAKALVDLARAEKDPQLKKEIVSKLSVMKAPEATDYLLELLK